MKNHAKLKADYQNESKKKRLLPLLGNRPKRPAPSVYAVQRNECNTLLESGATGELGTTGPTAKLATNCERGKGGCLFREWGWPIFQDSKDTTRERHRFPGTALRKRARTKPRENSQPIITPYWHTTENSIDPSILENDFLKWVCSPRSTFRKLCVRPN